MASIYALVKKNSVAHKSVMASPRFKNDSVIPVAQTHVLVPSHRTVDFGHNVSHAKNRVQRLRLPSLQAVTLQVNGVKKSLRITSRDKRSLKKILKTSE